MRYFSVNLPLTLYGVSEVCLRLQRLCYGLAPYRSQTSVHIIYQKDAKIRDDLKCGKCSASYYYGTLNLMKHTQENVLETSYDILVAELGRG